MTKGSRYDLNNSFMYLRLALQSMSKRSEQEAVALTIKTVADLDQPMIERLRLLAKIIEAKTHGMEEGK